MSDKELAFDFLEKSIPALAQSALMQAYWQTLASGHSVLSCTAGFIYEEFPDGTRRVIKAADPSFAVALGTKREIR